MIGSTQSRFGHMNIFLIGYRCTGKTSVGKYLSKRLGWSFFDTDVELVREQSTRISEIVRKQGWGAFREMETDIIKKVCSLDDHVVATGGGVVLNNENVRNMKASGVMVWLKATAETIRERMVEDENTRSFRPSLTSRGSVEEIQEMLLVRNPYYKDAMDFFVDTDFITIKAICDLIIKKL